MNNPMNYLQIPVPYNPYGVLSNPLAFATPMGQGNVTPPILASAGTRTQAPLALPPQRVGTDEMLMRVGGRMMGGAQKGGLNAMDEGIQEYGRIQDANRSNALREYNAKVMGQYRDALAQKAMKGKGQRTKQPSPYNQVVVQDIDSALSLLYAGHKWNEEKQRFDSGDIDFRDNVTGFGAETIGKMVAGSPAADFAGLIATIESNIGFDRLQKMRDDSPTGGALGQVSNQELGFLKSALGNLQQSQSPEMMRRNLLRVREQYLKTIMALRNEYAAAGIDLEDVMQGPPSGASSAQQPTTDDEALVQKYLTPNPQ